MTLFMDSLGRYETTLDDDLRLLADQQSRLLIQYFMDESTTPASLDELIDYVSAHTNSDTTRETIQLTLHHKNHPKLADHGLIEYHSRSGDIRYHRHNRIETLLECLPGG